MKKNNFVFKPHDNTGCKVAVTVMCSYTGVVDELLSRRVTNSEVINDRIKELGYTGSASTISRYFDEHKDLVPAERQGVSPQGNRGDGMKPDLVSHM